MAECKNSRRGILSDMAGPFQNVHSSSYFSFVYPQELGLPVELRNSAKVRLFMVTAKREQGIAAIHGKGEV